MLPGRPAGWGSLGKEEASLMGFIREGVMQMLVCESLVGCSGWRRPVRAARAGDTESVMGLWLEVMLRPDCEGVGTAGHRSRDGGRRVGWAPAPQC